MKITREQERKRVMEKVRKRVNGDRKIVRE